MAQIFPDSLLNDIHNKVKLSDFISQYTQLKKRGDEFVGLCPFHKESGPSFTVNDIKGVYYCFGCGAKGDVIDFVINKKNVKFYDAVSEIANLYNIYIPPQIAEEYNISDRAIDVQINRIRSKIEFNSKQPIYLTTVRNKGYLLKAEEVKLVV